MIFYQICTRREILENVLLRRLLPPTPIDRLDDLAELKFREDEAALVWEGTVNNLRPYPRVMLSSPRMRRDIFALLGASTDFPKPFSAYCRALSFDDLLGVIKPSDYLVDDTALEGISVGLILAEALLRGGDRIEFSNLTPGSCQRTLSFVLGSACLHRYGFSAVDSALENWKSTSNALGHSEDEKIFSVLRQVWTTVHATFIGRTAKTGDAIDSDLKIVADFLSGLFARNKTSTNNAWGRLLDAAETKAIDLDLSQQTREQRAKFLQDFILEAAERTNRWDSAKSFLAGYLANQIAPGSMEHRSILHAIAPFAPAALLWYGVCAGVSQSKELFQVGGGLGLRVARDLSKKVDLLSLPEADIAFEEFREIISMRRGADLGIRTLAPNLIEVELIPLVSGTFRLNAAESRERPIGNDLLGFADSNQHLELRQKLASDLQSVIERLTFLRDEVAGNDIERSSKVSKAQKKRL